jgi:hypothetical protein
MTWSSLESLIFQSSMAICTALELSSKGTRNTRHPGVYLSPHRRCSPTRVESSTFGYDEAGPAENQASPPRAEDRNGFTGKEDMGAMGVGEVKA